MLALGLYSGRVMVVDEATGEEKWADQAHSVDSRAHVAMSPSGRFVASVWFANSDGCWGWELLDAASGDVHMEGITHDGTHPSCICSVQNRAWREECPVVAHTSDLSSMAFSPCGQRLATGSKDGVVILWDTQTGEAEQRLEQRLHGGPQKGHQRRIQSLSFSADGARLASSSGARLLGDSAIRIWDVTTGVLLRTIWKQERAQFSPTDKKLLASSTGGAKIYLWDVDTGEILSKFAGSKFAAFSPDGRTIATRSATSSCEVHLVDVESGTERVRVVDQEASVLCASFGVNPKP